MTDDRFHRLRNRIRSKSYGLKLSLLRKPAPPWSSARVGVIGCPDWLIGLFGDDVKLITHPRQGQPDVVLVGPDNQNALTQESIARVWGDLPVVSYRGPAIGRVLNREAFVQPRLHNPIEGKVDPNLPLEFRSLATDACRTSNLDVSDQTNIHAETHRKYRVAMSRTTRHFISDILQSAGLDCPEIRPEVTMVCVTNRPENLAAVVENFERQEYSSRRLLVVANSDRFARSDLMRLVGDSPFSSWMSVDEAESLGSCLNYALEQTQSRYVAKVDDDDIYGSKFLSDLMLGFQISNAAVLGKHSYYAGLDGGKSGLLRFPGNEFRFTSFVAGGTLLMDRNRTRNIVFEDRSIGEDTAFLLSCRKAGLDVLATDRYGYVQSRNVDNTWDPGDSRFRAGSTRVHGDIVTTSLI